MGHPDRVCRICGEAGERMASLVCLAPRNLRQRFRWRRLGVDPLAPTQARSMGISHEAAKSGHTTALLGRDPIVVSPGAISIRRPGQRDEAAHPPSSVRRFGCQFKTLSVLLGRKRSCDAFLHELAPDRPGSLGRNAAGAAYPNRKRCEASERHCAGRYCARPAVALMLMAALAIRLAA
jgi:hypothetical protein